VPVSRKFYVGFAVTVNEALWVNRASGASGEDSPRLFGEEDGSTIAEHRASTYVVSAHSFRHSMVAACLSLLAMAKVQTRLGAGAEPLTSGPSSPTAASESVLEVAPSFLYADKLFAAMAMPEIAVSRPERWRTYRADDVDGFVDPQAFPFSLTETLFFPDSPRFSNEVTL